MKATEKARAARRIGADTIALQREILLVRMGRRQRDAEGDAGRKGRDPEFREKGHDG